MHVRWTRKKEIQTYLIDTLLFGFILGLIVFPIILIWNNIAKSAIYGLTWGWGTILIIQIIRFIIKVLIIRRSKIKKLKTNNFKGLNHLGIHLQDDLFFKGDYEGFTIHIYPRETNIGNTKSQVFTINIFYKYPDTLKEEFSRWKFDQENSKKYKVGKINFGGHVAILQHNNINSRDITSSINFMLKKMKELNLTPLDYTIWERKYILPLKEKHDQERKQTINLLKKHLLNLIHKIKFHSL